MIPKDLIKRMIVVLLLLLVMQAPKNTQYGAQSCKYGFVGDVALN